MPRDETVAGTTLGCMALFILAFYAAIAGTLMWAVYKLVTHVTG